MLSSFRTQNPSPAMELTTVWETISIFTPFFISILLLFLLKEQITYFINKSNLPGPTFILPFFGTLFSVTRDPTAYWFRQSRYAASTPLGVSANYLAGRFIVFIRRSDLSHRVISTVRPDAFQLFLHPFGKKLFGENNLVYLSGQPHKDIRRRILPNFSPSSLSSYAEIQQRVMLKHLTSWEELSNDVVSPIKLRTHVRDMNLDASQAVFVGPYMNPTIRRQFDHDYNLFNVGLTTMPFDFPGFAFRHARLAVGRLMKTLGDCAAESKRRMAAGAKPACLIDFWMQDTLKEEIEARKLNRKISPPLPSSAEIGSHLFDFLLAAQDASTSSLLWAVTLLGSHPEVLAKVREEVAEIWSPASGKFITAEQLSAMKYTRAVALEVLRFRPPAAMLPHVAQQDFPLTEEYTIPKGAIVMPSVYESSFQGFTEPDRFDPDRFLEERGEDRVYDRNFLVFGVGPHRCVGRRYATNYLVLFIAMFTGRMEFKRHETEGCDEMVHIPSTSPRDECAVFLSRRELRA